ncbi:MAG: NAD(+) diphosphatase [Pseudomonadota bacterium]
MIDEFAITFNGPGGATGNRGSVIREDPAKVQALWEAETAKVVPYWRGKPLFRLGDGAPRLGWLSTDAPILGEADGPAVLLGVPEGVGHFAVDVSAWEDPNADAEGMKQWVDKTENVHPSLPDDHKFIDLRSIMAELGPEDAADAASGKGCFEWHRTHQFCARCGHRSDMDQAGWRRKCPSCGAFHFPRTDPVVIMLILHKDKALVGRQAVWPPTMWSLLAGFMEPGETIEAAVRRETLEEAGVPVGRVHYAACQPWPFPSSLMIACVGEALTDELDPDYDEIEAAIWVDRQDMLDAVAGTHPKIGAARKGAIARDVLDAWAEGRIPDFD